jgi:hypothetical protein
MPLYPDISLRLHPRPVIRIVFPQGTPKSHLDAVVEEIETTLRLLEAIG